MIINIEIKTEKMKEHEGDRGIDSRLQQGDPRVYQG